MDSYFLGIDPSATSTGLSLVGSQESHTFLIKPGKRRGEERLKYIYDQFNEFLGKRAIYMSVIEAPSFGSVHKEFILGEVLGVIKLALIQKDILSLAIPPTQIKMFLTGRGNATKKDMIKTAQERGCPSSQEDICDSWAAALLSRDILLGPSTSKRKSIEAVQNIRAKYAECLSQFF